MKLYLKSQIVRKLTIKDKINKIAGIFAASILVLLILGYITSKDLLLGFPNIMMVYGLMPLVLIWFGTRKNGCGSCNQTDSIHTAEKSNDSKYC